jgi:hypothetical protein
LNCWLDSRRRSIDEDQRKSASTRGGHVGLFKLILKPVLNTALRLGAGQGPELQPLRPAGRQYVQARPAVVRQDRQGEGRIKIQSCF